MDERPVPVAVVTGGSRGIGAATCRLLADRGYAVCVSYRTDRAAADRVVEQCRAMGVRALAVAADVAVEDEVERLFAAVDDTLGRPTVLVCSAGIVAGTSRVDAMPAERITRMLAVNVVGTLICAREAVRRMSTRHGGAGGAIVTVSSAAARLGGSGQYVDYAASKGAVDSLTVGLAREVAAEGVRVNAVRPGVIDTEIHASAGNPNRVNELGGSVPLGRAGTAEEVAAAIVWLCSDAAAYTTGAILDVTGGR
jgi:NAD(P)-dependent dehydrogenase (short-subunit alcohol dehydrogenase family)